MRGQFLATRYPKYCHSLLRLSGHSSVQVSHALRGKRRPSDSESRKKGKVRKNDDAIITKPVASNTASFPPLCAADLGTSRHRSLQQRNQYDQLPSHSALSRVPDEGVAEFIRMQSAAAAAARLRRLLLPGRTRVRPPQPRLPPPPPLRRRPWWWSWRAAATTRPPTRR